MTYIPHGPWMAIYTILMEYNASFLKFFFNIKSKYFIFLIFFL